MPAPNRRVPSVVAGVVAMAASFSALAAVVWSDLAEASVQPPAVELTDELTEAPPVKLQKLDHKKRNDLADLAELLEREARENVRFGKFEGY